MPAKKTTAKPASQAFQLLDEAEVPVEQLVDDPENANYHDEDNLAQVATSLETFGQPIRLIVRKSDSVVFDGNGRLEAMRRLGWGQARVQYVEGSDMMCRAFAIAAQDTARTSRFDQDMLAGQLARLAKEGLLQATTYTQDRLDDLLASLEKPDPPKDGGDNIPQGAGGALATCPKCKTEFRIGGDK